MSRRSLLEQVQGALERTYAMLHVIDDVGRFVISDEGYRSLYAGRAETASAGEGGGAGGKTLVRETDGEVRVCIYYPGPLLRCLERHPPQTGLREANVHAFATLVEELDHLLCIAERAVLARPLTMFELELHANVSKYLVLSRFLAGRSKRLGAERRAWLRYQLFFRGAFVEPDPGVRQRYRDAARWALRLLEKMERLRPARALSTLREFHRAGTADKLAMIRRLPGTVAVPGA